VDLHLIAKMGRHSRSGIRRRATAAQWVTATVVASGFNHRELGSKVARSVLARNEGYWSVFEPEEGEYYGFWGTDPDDLSAYVLAPM
jgi:hypothetical protein